MKRKYYSAATASELANLLDLPKSVAIEWEIKSELVSHIVKAYRRTRITHAKLAELAETSRTRVTAILGGRTSDVSIELLLRILSALGFKASLKVSKTS